jgi:HK97 family phage prohead protease
MKRTFTVEAQYRASSTDAGHTIEGYAALYDALSQPIYYVYDSEGQRKPVRERLARGAFNDAVGAGADVTSNINHDDDRLLGRTTSGTLELEADSMGLKFKTQVPDTSYARDLGILMQRGDIRDCSFAFTVDEADIERSVEGDYIVETVKRVSKLYDVAVVTRGAYPQPFSVFRDLPKDGSVIQVQDLAFRYSQEAEPAASTREGQESSEQTALRAQQEQRRTLELSRLNLATKAMEV